MKNSIEERIATALAGIIADILELGIEKGAEIASRKFLDISIEAEKRKAEIEKRPEKMLNAVKTVCIEQKIMSKPRLYKLIAQGKIRALKLGRSWMISETEMQRLHLML